MSGGICFIVCAGAVKTLAPARPGDFWIAADAGYRTMQEAGREPDAVLGDFDSLGYVPDHPAVLRFPVEKDDTDLGLACREAVRRGYRKIAVYGALGGRTDMTLASFQILAHLSRSGTAACLIGPDEIAAAVTGGTLRFSGVRPGARLSVFSLSDRAEGVCIEGVHYPLQDAALTSDCPLGISNNFEKPEARLSVAEGTLLAIWQEEDFDPASFFGRLESAGEH